MGVTILSTKNLATHNIKATTTQSAHLPAIWVRPADWLEMPTILATEEKFVGIHAVHPDSNFLAMTFGGAYTVTWGDGLVENFDSGVTAYHQYLYSNSALTGTDTSKGYKQAIVTVTPQTGQKLTSMNLNVRHKSTKLNAYTSGFLDIIVSAPNLTTLTISEIWNKVKFNLLERAQILSHGLITSYYYLFYNCVRLQSVSLPASNVVSDFSYMFNNCSTLHNVPFFNTSSGTNFSNMFSGCSTLHIVPFFNTSSGTNFNTMFFGCSALQTVPLLDTALGTSFYYMFNNCFALQNVPLLNTVSGTNFNAMFASCLMLQNVPLFNTISGTDFGYMFLNCYALQNVPLFNTSSGTDFNNMFVGCSTLQNVPLFNTISGTDLSGMFNGCFMLQNVPLFNTISGKNFSYMFSGCPTLQNVPLLNTASGTDFSYMFNGCSALQTVPLLDTVSGTDFENMFNSCSTLQNVPLLNTVSGKNFDAMFAGCSALQNVPLLNISSGTDFNYMFSYCTTIQSIPALNMSTGKSWNFNNTFAYCPQLSSISVYGLKYGIKIAGLKLSRAALEAFMVNLDHASGEQTLDISDNWGIDAAISKTGTTTAGSNIVMMADTSSLIVGMSVYGTGMSVSADTSETVRFGTFIDSIVTNTSITLNSPATASASVTLSIRFLNIKPALQKGWTIAETYQW